MILLAILATVAVSINPPAATTYTPVLEWCTDATPASHFNIERAPAFIHPYVRSQFAVVQSTACPVVAVQPDLCPTGKRHCKWIGPRETRPAYYWHWVNGVLEPNRQEVEIRTDPLP